MRSRKRSLGFTLIELSIVLMISMLATTWALWAKVNQVREMNADVQGDAIKTLSNSVGTYMTNNYGNLVNNTAIAGFANIYAPTIPELIAAGLLSNNFSTSNFYGGNYGIQVAKFPAACTPPNCDLTSLVYLTNPIIDYRNGLIDAPTLGEATRRIGGDGGWSTRVSPGTINGSAGGWNVPNPVTIAGQPAAGILAVRGGYGSSGWSQFLRRDGTLPMTGALNMGNNNVNNANQINSVTLATTSAVTVGGNLSVAGASVTNGITNTGPINTTTLATTGGTTVGGTLSVAGATTTNGITNTGPINTTTLATTGGTTVGGTLTVAGATTTNGITNTGDISTGRLVLTTTVANGDPCVGLNGYQARTTAGSIASCINSVWTTPNATAAATPCTTQTVGGWSATGGSNGYCYGSASASASGATVSVSASSGGSGTASYTCLGGVWAWNSGSCTPTPCSSQTVYWGAGCSGTASGPTASGSSVTVTQGYPGSGQAAFKCTGGNWAQDNSQASSCSAPVQCPAQTVYWSDPSGVSGCSATVGSATAPAVVGVSMKNSIRYGTGTASCSSSGSWSAVGSCNKQTVVLNVGKNVKLTDGTWEPALVADSNVTWMADYCTTNQGAGWTVYGHNIYNFQGQPSKACWSTQNLTFCNTYAWSDCSTSSPCNALISVTCQAP